MSHKNGLDPFYFTQRKDLGPMGGSCGHEVFCSVRERTYFKICLFISFWPRRVFLAIHRLIAGDQGYSRGFASWSAGLRGTGFSSCGSRAPGRGLSSCGAQAQLPRGTWDLPGSGVETMSPLLAEFLTTGPPGKSQGRTL